jgi:hypothetical protein
MRPSCLWEALLQGLIVANRPRSLWSVGCMPNDAVEQPRGLHAGEAERDRNERRCLKVSLPVKLHIKLHALKLYNERTISETVEAALAMYFEKLRESPPAPAVGSMPPPLGSHEMSG